MLKCFVGRDPRKICPSLGEMRYSGCSKNLGRMGTKEKKNSKALAEKLVWRLISIETLWTQVVTHKYI